MSALPSGLVTFLMTDIEASTELLRRVGRERYAELLETHRAILAESVQAFGGHLVDSQGDSTFSVFERPSAAVP